MENLNHILSIRFVPAKTCIIWCVITLTSINKRFRLPTLSLPFRKMARVHALVLSDDNVDGIVDSTPIKVIKITLAYDFIAAQHSVPTNYNNKKSVTFASRSTPLCVCVFSSSFCCAMKYLQYKFFFCLRSNWDPHLIYLLCW